MTRYEWLTIIAIVLGPILALSAQRLLDTLRETKKRRVGLFFTLLTTRASPLAQAHVQALNSIDIVFAKDSDRPIRDAWQRVREQMSIEPTRPDWFDRLNDLKCDLLQVMGGSVGFDFTVDYLKRQGYLPKHYTDMEQEQALVRARMVKVLTDDGIRVIVTQHTNEPRPAKDSS